MSRDVRDFPINDGLAIDDTRTDIVHVDFLELRLPCRSYRISYKVAEASDFSLTTEFLLRLLRLTNGMHEDQVAEFFGFSSEETRFVVDHVQSLGFASRRNGRVHLTESGHALFVGGEEPALFEVHSKQELFDFDLISFAPADRRSSLSPLEYELPELTLAASSEVGKASTQIVRSFKRFFQEFRSRRGGNSAEKHALYTVDDVKAERRYSTLVPITVSVGVDNPSTPEADLLSWRTGVELEDRSEIIQTCAAFIRSVRARSDHVGEVIDRIIAVAPDQLLRFTKGGSFNSEMFFRATARQAGELRSDRPTVRTVGSLWTEENKSRFALALRYAHERSAVAPPILICIRPSVPHWGMTMRLVDTLAAVQKVFSSPENSNKIKAIMVTDGTAPKALEKVFNAILPVFLHGKLSALEVFLIPNHLAFVSVRTPLGSEQGYPIPLGVISFDLEVVKRVHGIVSELLEGARGIPSYIDWVSASIMDEIESALKAGSE
jgi:hypothetical protein